MTATIEASKAGVAESYFVVPEDGKFDSISGDVPRKLMYLAGGVWKESSTETFMPLLRSLHGSRNRLCAAVRGHYAREFAKHTDGGMVGVNVGIPVPLGVFGFTRHKQSFFGNLHCMGRDGFIFFTETKNFTTTWFTGKTISAKVSTWDGTMTRG